MAVDMNTLETIQWEVLEENGWNQWVMSLQKSNIGPKDEDGNPLYPDMLVGSGWQTWSSNKCTTDEDGNFTMAWIKFNDEIQANLEDENGNKDFTNIGKDFNTYYHGPHSSGKAVQFAGFCNYSLKKVAREGEIVGLFATDFVFDEALYDRYIDTIPCKVESIVNSKSYEADNAVKQSLADGIMANSVNLTLINIDGTEVTEPVAYKYTDVEQTELLKAFMAVNSGVSSYRVKLVQDKKAVVMNAEQIVRLYCELELHKKTLENRAEVFKTYLSTFDKNDKKLEDVVQAIKFEDPMPKEYEDMVDELNNESAQSLMSIVEKFGFDK